MTFQIDRLGRWRGRVLVVCCLALVASAALACGGGEEEVEDIVIDLPTAVPLTEADIRATLVLELTPPTLTPDIYATKEAEYATVRGVWPTKTSASTEQGYYFRAGDADYVSALGPSIWHALRIDILVSGLYLGAYQDNVDLVEFFGDYELVDRPSQWKCNEPLRSAVHRERVNLRQAVEVLSDYREDDVSPAVRVYVSDLRQGIRDVDQVGNAFDSIQKTVCAAGYDYGQLDSDGRDVFNRAHEVVTSGVASFQHLMTGYGCAICGDLYRR